MQTWYVLAGIAVGVVSLGTIARFGWRFLRRITHFLDDWVGEEARPGVPERPGVMKRLDNIEHEVTLNSGQSLKDKVVSMDTRLGAIEGKRP